MNHLVIVCCHAVWGGGPSGGQVESEWYIEDFQVGETPTFLDHIRKGVEIAQRDRRAAVVFSGGVTKPHRTNVPEGFSYLRIAERWLPHDNVKDRLYMECAAVDSYQNLLFSILEFNHRFQEYPSHVTIVSHDFKKERFLDIHCKAIQWPLHQVTYVGIDPPESVTPRAELDAGEEKARALWLDDLYGTHGELDRKRRLRNWNPRNITYDMLTEDRSIQRLINYDGGPDHKTVFPRKLPWAVIDVSD